MKDVHEHRMALLGLLVEAAGGPDPVQVGAIGAQVQGGHAAANGEVVGWHGNDLARLETDDKYGIREPA